MNTTNLKTIIDLSDSKDLEDTVIILLDTINRYKVNFLYPRFKYNGEINIVYLRRKTIDNISIYKELIYFIKEGKTYITITELKEGNLLTPRKRYIIRNENIASRFIDFLRIISYEGEDNSLNELINLILIENEFKPQRKNIWNVIKKYLHIKK